MTYLTTAFYLVGGALCLSASLFMFFAYFKVHRRANLSLAFVYFWIALHAFAFAIPTVFDEKNLELLGVGYIVGISMIFLTLIAGIDVQTFMSRKPISKRVVNAASTIITLLAISTIIIMYSDFRLPIINSDGIIFWNINPLAAWTVGLSSFIYGCIWGYLFYQAALLINDAHARVRLLVISADGFILGSVALLVHTSTNEIQTVAGHSLFILAGLITVAIYLLPDKIFRTSK